MEIMIAFVIGAGTGSLLTAWICESQLKDVCKRVDQLERYFVNSRVRGEKIWLDYPAKEKSVL